VLLPIAFIGKALGITLLILLLAVIGLISLFRR
jgi:hypothetical protein